MGNIDIHLADDQERRMASLLLAGSEPWITLNISTEQCERNCNDPEFKLYIAVTGRKQAGIILLDPRGVAGSPYIKSIAVYPEFRSQGIGSALLSFAENLFKGKARYIFICVSSFNLRARELYEKCGYQITGELRDYIIDGASEILMQKRI